MTSTGSHWKQQRDLLQPSFKKDPLRGYVSPMNTIMESFGENWKMLVSSNAVVDVAEEMSRLTVRILGQCMFGVDIDDRIDEFFPSVSTMNESIAHFDPFCTERISHFQSAQKSIFAIAESIIQEGKSVKSKDPSLLSVLLRVSEQSNGAFTEQHLIDQVVTFLMAGHETTAKCLTWTLYLLEKHPEILIKVRREALAVIGDTTPDAAALLHWTILGWCCRNR